MPECREGNAKPVASFGNTAAKRGTQPDHAEGTRLPNRRVTYHNTGISSKTRRAVRLSSPSIMIRTRLQQGSESTKSTNKLTLASINKREPYEPLASPVAHANWQYRHLRSLQKALYAVRTSLQL